MQKDIDIEIKGTDGDWSFKVHDYMKNKAAQQLGKLGGQVKSEAKTRAARENGKLGGRPKKNHGNTERESIT